MTSQACYQQELWFMTLLPQRETLSMGVRLSQPHQYCLFFADVTLFSVHLRKEAIRRHSAYAYKLFSLAVPLWFWLHASQSSYHMVRLKSLS